MVHLRSVRVMTMYFPFVLASDSAASAMEEEFELSLVLWASLWLRGEDLDAMMPKTTKSDASSEGGKMYVGDLISRRRVGMRTVCFSARVRVRKVCGRMRLES